MKASKSGLNMCILPSGASHAPRSVKPSAFSKYQSAPCELSRRGPHNFANPCLENGGSRLKHARVPSWGSEYSKLVAI